MSGFNEPFELRLLGGSVEQHYRKLRPEIDELPWELLDPSAYEEKTLRMAQQTWTRAAFQEYRTGAACTATLEALLLARAPLDLCAMATQFPLDEIAHVEICARLSALFGGAVPLRYCADQVTPRPSILLRPLVRAAELVVRVFCVGEAVSIPLLRSSAEAAQHPLIRAVLQRIVKDEAAHGRFGWIFLDWLLAEGALTDAEFGHLQAAAADEINKLEQTWASLASKAPDTQAEQLGWMDPRTYLDVARRSLATHVQQPLNARGFGRSTSASQHCVS